MSNDLVFLKAKIETLKNPLDFIENLSEKKSVLNVGAAGGVLGLNGYLPNNEQNWLHSKIISSAEKVLATDIDEEAIQHAKKYGYKMIKQNCEIMNLAEKFEIIIMSDVIEHLDAPVKAIKNLVDNHLTKDGILVITTPNGSASNIFFRSLIRNDLNVYYDHMAVYYPEHFQAICNRLGYSLKKVYLFDHSDKRSLIIKIKGLLFNFASFMFPRLSSAMMVLIQK